MENISRISVSKEKTSSLAKTSKNDDSYARVMGAIVGLHIVAIGVLYNLGMYLVASAN